MTVAATVDIAPTHAALGGIRIRAKLDGRSLVAEFNKADYPCRY